MFNAAIAAAATAAPHKAITVPLQPGLQVHVDGDYLAYFASGNDECTPGQARQNALGLLEQFRARIGAEHVIVHNTAPGCHKGERYLVATVKPYQGQRDGGRKPKNHAYLQDFLQSYEGSMFRAKNWTTREADDGMGACAHYAANLASPKPDYVGIATADKDLRMLPGAHINWKSQAVTRVYPGDYDVIGEDMKQYGLKFFFIQMLMGDTADNCPGLEKIKQTNNDGSFKSFARCGEKTALKLLDGIKTVDDACGQVIELYRHGYYGQPEGFADDRFCEQAALLWMRLDNKGSVTDFARHKGHSCITQSFDARMWAAVERLEQRVLDARTALNELTDQYDPLTADNPAA